MVPYVPVLPNLPVLAEPIVPVAEPPIFRVLVIVLPKAVAVFYCERGVVTPALGVPRVPVLAAWVPDWA